MVKQIRQTSSCPQQSQADLRSPARNLCRLSLSLTCLLLTVLLSACTKRLPATSDVPDQSADRPISLFHYFSDTLGGGIGELVALFNARQAPWRLDATPLDHEAFKSSIVDTLERGNPPDIYSYWAGARTRAIIDKLRPIDELWLYAKLDDLFPASLRDSAARYNGKLYLLPLTQHLVGFFYNKRLFAEAGVEPPETWEDFLSVCEAFKRRGITPLALGARDRWPAQFWLDYLLIREQGLAYREALMRNEISWTDPGVVQAFETWKLLLDRNYFNSDAGSAGWDTVAGRLVAEGDAAMTLMGTWQIGVWKAQYPDWSAGSDFGFFPFPALRYGPFDCSVGPVDGLVLPVRAGNPKGALRVLEFLAQAESQQIMAQGSGAIAPNRNVNPELYGELGEDIHRIIQSSAAWAFNYDLATTPQLAEIGLNLFVEFLEFPEFYRELLERSSRLALAATGEQ